MKLKELIEKINKENSNPVYYFYLTVNPKDENSWYSFNLLDELYEGESFLDCNVVKSYFAYPNDPNNRTLNVRVVEDEVYKRAIKEYNERVKIKEISENFDKYINYVKEGASDNYTLDIALVALVEEVGEVAGLIKKKTIYPDFDFQKKCGNSFEEEIKDELGDVLWQYVNLCNQCHLDIKNIINHNVEKLEKRHGNQKVAKDGGKR